MGWGGKGRSGCKSHTVGVLVREQEREGNAETAEVLCWASA